MRKVVDLRDDLVEPIDFLDDDLVEILAEIRVVEPLWEKLREPRMAAPPRLVAMANAGLLGRKTGRGFYRYDA